MPAGLRLTALVDGKPAPPGAVSYSIYSDDREQFESCTAIISGAKPNLIIRLNSGIYRIVSIYGDANAKIETDVTVEAGKLTETTVTHKGGKATFKLVTRAGGEAMPDTRWTIQTERRRDRQRKRRRAADPRAGAGQICRHGLVGRANLPE